MRWVPLGLVAGCGLWLTDADVDERVDADGDGVSRAEDCNDADPTIHPGAAEWCDLVDHDCDGAIDEEALTGFRDEDGTDGEPLDEAASVVLSDYDHVAACGGQWSAALGANPGSEVELRTPYLGSAAGEPALFAPPEWVVGDGGWLALEGGSATLGSLVLLGESRSDNGAPWLTVDGTTVSAASLTVDGASGAPVAVLRGGALELGALSLTGGVFTDSAITLTEAAALTCADCSARDNVSSGEGAVLGLSGNSTASWSGEFLSNRASSGGVAMVRDSSSLVLRDVVATGNRAVEDGGVISGTDLASRASLHTVVAEDNEAGRHGGVASVILLDVVDSDFARNQAGAFGGDVFAGAVSVEASTFTGSTAAMGGSLAFLHSGVLVDSAWKGGHATLPFDENALSGGGCVLAMADVLITGSSFTECRAEAFGGALATHPFPGLTPADPVGPRPSVRLAGVDFVDNSATGGGAVALLIAEMSELAEGGGVSFVGNAATEVGGAIAAADTLVDPVWPTVRLLNGNFEDNTATAGTAVALFGVAYSDFSQTGVCPFTGGTDQHVWAEGRPATSWGLCEFEFCSGLTGCSGAP